MARISRNAQVLRYLVGAAPGCGRTHLLKFAYLSDCEARRYLGAPITEFNYIRYDHGPFAAAFYGAIEELESAELLAGSTVVFPNGYKGWQYEPTPVSVAFEFSPAEGAVLEYVARTYMGMSVQQLCDDVVYQTLPMTAGAAQNDPLPMNLMDGTKLVDGFDLPKLLTSEASARSGKHRPLDAFLDEVIRELVAADNSGSGRAA